MIYAAVRKKTVKLAGGNMCRISYNLTTEKCEL